MTKEAEALRRTFDEEPELYDRTRPGYPPGVFEDLAALAELSRGSRVLELGCGAGQATVPLAERGYRVVALDLGEGMAAVARRKLAGFPAVSTHHIRGGDTQFFQDVQRCYERWVPGTPPGFRLPRAADIPNDSEAMDRSRRFSRSVSRRYQWEQTYSTSEYLDLLQSYSGHRALDRPTRTALLQCIADLISSAYSGKVSKRYLTELRVARTVE